MKTIKMQNHSLEEELGRKSLQRQLNKKYKYKIKYQKLMKKSKCNKSK